MTKMTLTCSAPREKRDIKAEKDDNSSEKTASIHVEKTRLGRFVPKKSLIHGDSGVGSACFSQKSPVG